MSRDDNGFSRAQRMYDNMEPPEAEPWAGCRVCHQEFLWEDCKDADTDICPKCEAEEGKDEMEHTIPNSGEKLAMLRDSIQCLLAEYEAREGMVIDMIVVFHPLQSNGSVDPSKPVQIRVTVKTDYA